MHAHPIRAVLLPILAAAALVLASSCSEEPGTPSPNDNPGENTQPTAATSGPAGTPLDAIVACDLLSVQDLSQFDVTEPGVDEGALGGSDTSACGWDRASTDKHAGASFGIVVRPNQGIDSVVVNSDRTIEDGSFEDRPARILKQQRAAGASCMLALAVGNTSRVDVNVVAAGRATLDEVCDTVNEIATIVEPKLPKDGGS
ncbi:MAG: DUF3558 family protein [Haloechinothrix sp.]